MGLHVLLQAVGAVTSDSRRRTGNTLCTVRSGFVGAEMAEPALYLEILRHGQALRLMGDPVFRSVYDLI